MNASRARFSLPLIAACITAAGVVTACIQTSPDPRIDPALRSPLGVHGQIDVGGDRYEGELLTITAADFALLTDRHLVVIPFAIAGDARFSAIGVSTFRAPWTTHAEQLKYASRYPYGIPPAALDAILRQRGQTAPDTIKISTR
jgi:hypothetical protein